MAGVAGYTVTHINTVTTIFTPQASCFASSNLWLQTTGCATYYPPFSQRPTKNYLQGLECPYTVLGPRQNGNKEDNSCYQYNAFTAPGTVYSACPQSMTSAGEETTSLRNGVVLIQTACCPEAYHFSAPSGLPDTSPTFTKGYTYSVRMNTDSLCKATQVPELAGKNLTITRSTSPQVATTTATWKGGALFATPHYLLKYIYQGDSTTSTCFGGGCPDQSNPLVSTPTPTSAPTDSYVPPPSHPVTQFTPAPSCFSKDNLFLVSSRCHLARGNIMTRSPPWLHCTIAKHGEPDTRNPDCYQDSSTAPSPSGTPTFYSACPVGYSIAHSTTRHPFDEGIYDEYGPSKLYSATLSSFLCCPTHYAFTYNPDDTLYSTTVHNREKFSLQFHNIAQCKMTHVWPLANRALTMTLSADDDLPGGRGKRPRGQQQVLAPKPTPPPVTTTRWDVTDKTLWAEAQHYSYIVFHETYTCYENCDEYFTYSYHNTDPNYQPTGVPRTVRTKPPAPPRPTTSSQSSSTTWRAVATSGVQGGGGAAAIPPVKKVEEGAGDMRREPLAKKGGHAKVHAPGSMRGKGHA